MTKAYKPIGGFGDAAAADVSNGKIFTSDTGIKQVGTGEFFSKVGVVSYYYSSGGYGLQTVGNFTSYMIGCRLIDGDILLMQANTANAITVGSVINGNVIVATLTGNILIDNTHKWDVYRR